MNEYSHEDSPPGFRFQLVLWLLGGIGFVSRALAGFLGLLNLRSKRDYRIHEVATERRLVVTLDRHAGSLNLSMVNRPLADIWAEEAEVSLIDVETEGETYTPAPVTLKLCELIAPSEALHISLINTVYNAAGRPQGVYSCIISTKLRYRAHEISEGQPLEQSVPSYRATMIGLVPISLRQIGWLDRAIRFRRPEKSGAAGRSEQSKRIRRSQRVAAQSDVIVEGKFSDGNRFLDTTKALVLSAHGCLVTLSKPVDIGESFVVRNVNTLREQTCHVVYIGRGRAGEIHVGLGFETEAPDFWGVGRLPSTGS